MHRACAIVYERTVLSRTFKWAHVQSDVKIGRRDMCEEVSIPPCALSIAS
jgi:hypothetical protein